MSLGALNIGARAVDRAQFVIGLGNFEALVKDEVFWKALRNSFIYLLATPIIMALSITLAIALNRRLPGIGGFRALYYVPVITGSVALTTFLILRLGYRSYFTSYQSLRDD